MVEIILGNKSKNILPFDVQKEYIQYHDIVDSKELPVAVLFHESKKLFLKKTNIDEKKKLLYLLAHNGTKAAYELLQKYLKKSEKQLKPWAELCLQECAGHLGGKLLGQEETFMVMSGAGGDGQRLRYYFIFSSVKSKLFMVAQKAVIKKSVKVVDKKLKGKTERMDFGKNYVFFSALLPMDVSAEMYFQEMYKITNSKKAILRYHYFVTNVYKPKAVDVQNYMNGLS